MAALIEGWRDETKGCACVSFAVTGEKQKEKTKVYMLRKVVFF